MLNLALKLKKEKKVKGRKFEDNNVKGNLKHAKENMKESCSDDSCNVPFCNGGNIQSDNLSLNLMSKGLNFGNLNFQGICGTNMCKFAEIDTFDVARK